MVEIIKDYWGIIIWLFAVSVWVGRMQTNIADLKSGKYVTNDHCQERQAGCSRANHLQFTDGQKQFERLEKLIEKIEISQQKHHDDVIRAIMEINKL